MLILKKVNRDARQVENLTSITEGVQNGVTMIKDHLLNDKEVR